MLVRALALPPQKGKDFVVVGCSYLEEGDINHRINTKLASALGVPMVLMYTCTDRSTPESIFQDVVISKRELTEGDNVVDLSGVIVNRVPMDKCAPVGVLPLRTSAARPSAH